MDKVLEDGISCGEQPVIMGDALTGAHVSLAIESKKVDPTVVKILADELTNWGYLGVKRFDFLSGFPSSVKNGAPHENNANNI